MREPSFNAGDILRYVHSKEYILITEVDIAPMLAIVPQYTFLVLASDKRKFIGVTDECDCSWVQNNYAKVA